MNLRELLVDRQAAVSLRWLDAVLADYGPQTAERWRAERDPFTNPVAHALASGLADLLEAVIGAGESSSRAPAALERIIRIRSVTQLEPSRAVGFVFRLRDAIRRELAAELAGGEHAGELAEIDARIERLALLAVDEYVRCREQVFRVRQEELKRSVASILRRWHAGEIPEADPDLVRLSTPLHPAAGR